MQATFYPSSINNYSYFITNEVLYFYVPLANGKEIVELQINKRN
jgi:hypothetical protein